MIWYVGIDHRDDGEGDMLEGFDEKEAKRREQDWRERRWREELT